MIPHVVTSVVLLIGSATIHAGDIAGNYSTATSGVDRWLSNGHRGGMHSGPWAFESASHGGFTGRFIGNSALGGADINTDGKSFAIFANPPGSPTPFYAARKTFAKDVLTTGDTISFQVAVNFRNGLKGFNLRDTADSSVWTFNVGRVVSNTSGYYIRNGPAASVVWDDGQRFGGYHANTVFTFIFTQRERTLDWTATRSGGLSATITGSAPVVSGTLATVRYFISGTDGGGLPENNLYFNNFTFETEPRGDAPLTLGERRLPGRVPSHLLRFSDPAATSVTVRTSHDGFSESFPLVKSNDVWEIDIRNLELPPGWHNFKFRLNGQWEDGPNRRLYLDGDGRIAMPPAVYLTWTGDPTTTMVVHWHNEDASAHTLRHRPAGSDATWSTIAAANTTPFPHTERHVHTVEITGLNPAGETEFEVDGYDEVFRFRTMPASLDEPVRFGVGGDVDIGPTADAMTAAIASHDPAFLVVGGDLAYADGRADSFWRWMRYFESWFHNARGPDGRLIPKIVGIGNHEVRHGYTQNHPDYDNTAAWRLRYAPYFFRFFAFPGEPGFGVIDFSDYLSLVVLDTDHANLIVDQNAWLESTLNVRRNRPHLIPIYHVPAWSSHRSFNDSFAVRVRENWVPLFESTGVKLAFEHHDHTLKRTKPLLDGQENPDGIVYFGDGLWGIGSRIPDASRWYLEQGSSSQHHVHLVTLNSNGRTIQSVAADGTFIGGSAPDHVLLSQAADGIPAPPGGLAAARIRPRSTRLEWHAVANATHYEIFRDDAPVATVATTTWTDDSRTPESSASYQVRAVNRSGDSSASPPLVVATPAEAVPPFMLDTPSATEGYLLLSPGLSLFAAVRGEDLYVATRVPTAGESDHFLFITTDPLDEAKRPAPWAKAGLTARPAGSPYLAAESESEFHAWFNAPDGSKMARSTAPDGRLEGVIDLVETFGTLPEVVHVAAVGYATADGGSIISQSPPGNGDEHLDPEEFLAIPLDAIRDGTGVGVFDRLDPALQFRAVVSATDPNDSGFMIRWKTVPGKKYQLWRSANLADESWEKVHPNPITAPSGANLLEFTDEISASMTRAFYRVEVVNE